MESEKVKEIKKCLENSIKFGMFIGKSNMVANIKLADILTLINELESENRELKKYKCDWLNSEKMHLQAELEDTEFEFGCANRSLQEVSKENQQLKDRIAELGFELSKKRLEINALKCGKEIAEGVIEVVENEKTKLALKQFAERLENSGEIKALAEMETMPKLFKNIHDEIVKVIDETLKEFLGNI